jgi:hypothetical protein
MTTTMRRGRAVLAVALVSAAALVGSIAELPSVMRR